MGTDEIIDAWGFVLAGAPLRNFIDWLGREMIRLETEAGDPTRDLTLDIRLVLAEKTRGDLDEAEAVEEINKLIPATADRALRRAIGGVSREDLTSDSRTLMETLTPAGS
jgi:hypothetical protein